VTVLRPLSGIDSDNGRRFVGRWKPRGDSRARVSVRALARRSPPHLYLHCAGPELQIVSALRSARPVVQLGAKVAASCDCGGRIARVHDRLDEEQPVVWRTERVLQNQLIAAQNAYADSYSAALSAAASLALATGEIGAIAPDGDPAW